MKIKRYDEERDIEQLDILGGYYGRLFEMFRKVEASRAELAELVAALEEIANPVKFMRERLKDGEQLDGMMVMAITSSPDFYHQIARAALAKHRGE